MWCVVGGASSSGFGALICLSQGVRGHFGVWGMDAEDKSLSYRELRNLVETVEEEALAGGLSDSNLLVFTDNSTA